MNTKLNREGYLLKIRRRLVNKCNIKKMFKTSTLRQVDTIVYSVYLVKFDIQIYFKTAKINRHL